MDVHQRWAPREMVGVTGEEGGGGPVLVEAVLLAVMGVGFLVSGWQGFRLRIDPEALAGLGKAER